MSLTIIIYDGLSENFMLFLDPSFKPRTSEIDGVCQRSVGY